MGLVFNDKEVGGIRYNGKELGGIIFNGHQIFGEVPAPPRVRSTTMIRSLDGGSRGVNILDDYFSGTINKANGGGWAYRAGGTTTSSGTGPGINNPSDYGYCHTETSFAVSRSHSERSVFGILTLQSAQIPAGTARKLILRVCVQGDFGYGQEGLDIQTRASDADTWESVNPTDGEIALVGWKYSNFYVVGNTIDNADDTPRTGVTVVANGGWIDFVADIPDNATQVILRPVYRDDPNTGDDLYYRHDIAIRQFHWTYLSP